MRDIAIDCGENNWKTHAFINEIWL